MEMPVSINHGVRKPGRLYKIKLNIYHNFLLVIYSSSTMDEEGSNEDIECTNGQENDKCDTKN